MIRITNIKRCHIPDYDKIFLIIRSTASLERKKSKLLDIADHMPDLSPSKDLFYKYLNHEKNGTWNKEVFENEYKPVFLKELAHNFDAMDCLRILKQFDKEGKKIALLCFCQDENLCHRKIVGEILRENGCNVIFDEDIDKKNK